MMLAGCTSEPNPNPNLRGVERPAPESGDYFLDTTDPHYQHVASALSLTDDPVAESNIEQILETPVAQWLNGSTKETVQIIKDNIDLSQKDSSIPMFVAYNIPFRDLGGEASGGAIDGPTYRRWVDAMSKAIGNHPSIVLLEPDALAGAPRIQDKSMRSERFDLLRDALQTMKDSNPNTAVYLDAGHSKWQDVAALVDLIKKVDPNGDLIYGLSLNVSNQRPEDELRDYAAQVWQQLGRKPFIMIDNSMNGAPNTAELLDWCNAKGEKIGVLDDGYFNAVEYIEEAYIKIPGESDGVCGTSKKAAGVFDNNLLLRQVSE